MLTDEQIMGGQTEPIARDGADPILRSARVEARDAAGAVWSVTHIDAVAEALSFVFVVSMPDARLAREIDPGRGLWWIPVPADLIHPFDNAQGTFDDEIAGYRVTFTS